MVCRWHSLTYVINSTGAEVTRRDKEMPVLETRATETGCDVQPHYLTAAKPPGPGKLVFAKRDRVR